MIPLYLDKQAPWRAALEQAAPDSRFAFLANRVEGLYLAIVFDATGLRLVPHPALVGDVVLPAPWRLGQVYDDAIKLWGHLQRAYAEQPRAFGAAVFYPRDQRWQRADGNTHSLTDKECALVQYLSDRPGYNVPRDELLAAVWGYHPDIDTHTVETHIYRLRQKIEPNPDLPIYVMTDEWGYRWMDAE